MANKNSFPSQNPANNDSMVGTFKQVLRKFLQRDVDDMLPVQVISVSADRKSVSVQPLIMVVDTLGNQIQRAPVAQIPVVTLGGGGFVLSFPIKAGDLGFMKSNDRDISLFMQGLKQAPPNTFRMHDFADSVFIPSVLAGYTINGDDTDRMILSSTDGSVRIAFSDSTIILTAPNVLINSNLVLNGNLNITGTMEGPESVDLLTHRHAQSGGGDTGEPIT